MSQLDLFGAPVAAVFTEATAVSEKKKVEKINTATVAKNEDVRMLINEAEEEIQTDLQDIEPGKADGRREAYPIMINPKEQAEVDSSTAGRSVVFENSNIGVKIKSRQNSNSGEADQPPKKPAPRKSIIVGQSKNEFSLAIDDKLSQVKNSIKVGLLMDAAAEKKRRQREERKPQKRGRKSMKEMDAEVDLVSIPDDEVLFQKQYYPISEVAGWFNVNTSLLRFWENEFDILKPRKNRKGDRLFRPEDVKSLQLIYQLLRQRKFSIEGAKEYLKSNKNKADTQLYLVNTLHKFRSFLLELKANL